MPRPKEGPVHTRAPEPTHSHAPKPLHRHPERRTPPLKSPARAAAPSRKAPPQRPIRRRGCLGCFTALALPAVALAVVVAVVAAL